MDHHDHTQRDVSFGADLLDGISPETLGSIKKALEKSDKKTLIKLTTALEPADLASFLENLSSPERERFFALIQSQFNFDVLLELSDHVRQQVVRLIGIKDLSKRLAELDSDDAFFLIDELTPEQQVEILAAIPAAVRASFEKVLSYPEHSAARLMQQELVAVPSFWKVGDVVKYIQESNLIPETFYEVYVVNPKHRALGSVAVSKLLRFSWGVAIKDIMKTDIKPIPAFADQEEVAYLFRHYNLVSAPVEDESGRIIGMITSDDVVEVIEEETEKEILQLAGVSETDFTAPFLVTSSHRIGWLAVSLVNALLAAFVIEYYKTTIEEKGSLAALMTIVTAMGSAIGTQVVTVTVRAYSTGVFKNLSPWKNLRKEALIGLANSIFFSIVLTLVVWLWLGEFKLAMIVPAALIFTMCWSSFAGVLFPILIARMGLDPAVSAGPLLAATSDVLGFAAFLGLASIFL